MNQGWIEELRFSVEIHTDAGIEEVLARCSHPYVARAAYREACKIYPTRLVMTRQGARILERSDRVP